MGSKKFKIILKNKESKTLDINYFLHDTSLAVRWFTKIKHLSKIQIDPVESDLADVSDLHEIYANFCDFAQVDRIPINQTPTQIDCNNLHRIYEINHSRLSTKKNNEILYRFHHAIHAAENNKESVKKRMNIGWGLKEGPLTQPMQCNPYYENRIEKNNLYLPWSELGKTPLTYWINNEPTKQKRFNILCKPHITFRAKFFIALDDIKGMTFPNQFNQYFNQFKQQWLKHYGIDDWTERDEGCAPMLAHTDSTIDLHGMVFQKIIT